MSATSLLPPVTDRLLIDGVWTPSSTGARFDVDDPATGRTLTSVADASAADGLAALDAAVSAQHTWADTAPRVRGEILRRTYEILVDRVDHFAAILTAEMGKTLAESRSEVLYSAEFFRWYSEEAVRLYGRTLTAPDGSSSITTLREPVGPCLFITPWNFPLAMGARKIGAALAAGCTCVIKPAKSTPLGTLALAEALLEAGLPAGVVNVVTTSSSGGVTDGLITDPRLRKISFTGSTPVGRHLTAAAAQRILKVSMELGGNAPFIVAEDADLDIALDAALIAKLRNGGQACTAANRFYVHRAVVTEFTDRLAEKFSAVRIGAGYDDNVDMGPLIDARAVATMEDIVSRAVADGARIAAGGRRPEGDGYFYEPTVLADVPADSTILTEEIFGPVAPIVTFDTDDEALAYANSTEYGLASYVMTESATRATLYSRRIAAGMVGVNRGAISNPAAPFGGIRASGLGREGGAEGVDDYLETKYVNAPI